VNWLVRDKSVSSHSVTLQETIAATSAEINGAVAYEISGRTHLIFPQFLASKFENSNC